MNEIDRQLRDLLEAAVGEPPHRVTVEAVRRRVVRRRVIESIAGAAAVAIIAAAVPVGIGALGRGPEPSAAGSMVPTVYVLSSQGTLTPVPTTTDVPGKPIQVGPEFGEPLMMAMTPDGKTIYVADGLDSVTPVSTVTNTAGKPIPLDDQQPAQILITPDGKTAYVLSIAEAPAPTVTPIATATNKPGKAIGMGTPDGTPDLMAITPDGKTLYVIFSIPSGPASTYYVLPISTATNMPRKPIKIDMYLPQSITMAPDGKTAYIVGLTNGNQGNQSEVIPLSTATNTPGEPVAVDKTAIAQAITPDGKTLYLSDAGSGNGVIPFATATNTFGRLIKISDGTVIAVTPDSSTVYVSSGPPNGLLHSDCPGPGEVTPISTATNVPGRPIQVACGAGIGAITTDGKTLWVGAGDMVTPIATATNTPGRPIEVGGPLRTIRNRYEVREVGLITAMVVTP